jgi:hypothetical protein
MKKFCQYITMTFTDRVSHPCIYWQTSIEKFYQYIPRELQWEIRNEKKSQTI